MKKILLVILITSSSILFSCWNGSSNGNVTGSNSFGIQNDKAVMSILIPESEDAGLFLYRKPKTKDLVIDFYSRITGSRDIALPIINYSEKNNIPLPLSFSLVWMESKYNPKAVNRNAHSIDRGLFQLNSKSFYFLKVKDFYNPTINAKYGTAHLRFCLESGKDDVVALAMYNAGTAGVKKGTPISTLRYISGILEYRDKLKREFTADIFVQGNIVIKGADYLADTAGNILIADNR